MYVLLITLIVVSDVSAGQIGGGCSGTPGQQGSCSSNVAVCMTTGQGMTCCESLFVCSPFIFSSFFFFFFTLFLLPSACMSACVYLFVSHLPFVCVSVNPSAPFSTILLCPVLFHYLSVPVCPLSRFYFKILLLVFFGFFFSSPVPPLCLPSIHLAPFQSMCLSSFLLPMS